MNSLLQLAQLCQKEMRKEAQRSQKVTQQTAPKARRLSREVYFCGALSKLKLKELTSNFLWHNFFSLHCKCISKSTDLK